MSGASLAPTSILALEQLTVWLTVKYECTRHSRSWSRRPFIPTRRERGTEKERNGKSKSNGLHHWQQKVMPCSHWRLEQELSKSWARAEQEPVPTDARCALAQVWGTENSWQANACNLRYGPSTVRELLTGRPDDLSPVLLGPRWPSDQLRHQLNHHHLPWTLLDTAMDTAVRLAQFEGEGTSPKCERWSLSKSKSTSVGTGAFALA